MHFLRNVPVPLFSLLVSFIALLFSGRSMLNSSQALRLAKSQDARRTPKITIYLTDALRRFEGPLQVFSFHVRISNPSDSNNAVARAELQVSYVLSNECSILLKLQHNLTYAVRSTNGKALQLPLKIEAHQTVAGWLNFALDSAVVGKGTVDSHNIILEDSHGITTTYDNLSVQGWLEKRSDDDSRGTRRA